MYLDRTNAPPKQNQVVFVCFKDFDFTEGWDVEEIIRYCESPAVYK